MSPAATTTAPRVRRRGSRLAPGYRVVGHVSRGEALDVYEVFSEELLCHCVAKTIRPDRVTEDRVVQRLLLEGELLGRLAHPHLVRALDVLEDDDGVPVVVLEMVPGPTLEEIVDSRVRRLSVAELAHLGRHLGSALHHLHAAGYVHLDVRPANVVARGGIATLIDLSIARPPGPVRRGLGSREYLSPEQARGAVVGPFSDVWGLGATLLEAATGSPPFAPLEDSERHGDFLQLRRSAPDPRTFGRRLPVALADLLREMLSPDPAGRPTVGEVHERLGGLLEGRP